MSPAATMNQRKLEKKHGKARTPNRGWGEDHGGDADFKSKKLEEVGRRRKRWSDDDGPDEELINNITKKPLGRPPTKPKEIECECFQPHDSLIRCKEEEKFRELCDITPKIISISEMITVFVGAEKETFAVHKDLLKLHSTSFREHLENYTEDGKLTLPNLKPTMFADFVSWMYNGSYLQVGMETLGVTDPCIQLWTMGAFLQAPSFQNFCMDDYRTFGKQSPHLWPCIPGIGLIYKLSEKGSLFRKFAAHSMTCKPPLETCKEESNEHKEWSEFLDRCPDLIVDMAKMGKSWNGTFAWDDVHRSEYMVEEIPVGKRWEDLILSTRSKEDIQKAAANGCRKSKIELEHLERNKSPDGSEVSSAEDGKHGIREFSRSIL